MKLLRTLNKFCLQRYLNFDKLSVSKLVYNTCVRSLSLSYCSQNKGRPIDHVDNILKNKPISQSNDQDLSSLQTPRKSIRDGAIEEWFNSFMEKLKADSSYTVIWENEDLNTNTRWKSVFPVIALYKLCNVTVQVPGLFENAMHLIDSIEHQELKKGVLDVTLLANKISLYIYQKKDHKKAFDYYRQFCQKSVLSDGRMCVPHNTCSSLVEALARTSEWLECLKLIGAMGDISNPTINMLSFVLSASLREKNDNIAKDMVCRIIELSGQPSIEAFEAILNYKSSDYLLNLLSEHHWLVNNEVAEVIENHFKNRRVPVERVKIHGRECPCCGNKLVESQDIPINEMKELVDTFYYKILLQRDGALNSTPEEVEKFVKYLSSNPKPDVVIDALNVAFHKRAPNQQSRDMLLADVITRFTKSGKRALVISKNHSRGKFKSSMNLHKNGHDVRWFFTEDRSHDDLFAVYGAFHGNEGCLMVTKDELRDHRFLLGPALLNVFKRWQRRHQVKLDIGSFKLSFQWPPSYQTIAQRSADGTLHIPFQDGTQMSNSFEHSNSWLCIREAKNL